MDKFVEQRCRVHYLEEAISKAMIELKVPARVDICANYQNAERMSLPPGSSAMVRELTAT